MQYERVKQLVPTLGLSQRECVELRELGDLFVSETMQQYLDLHVERKGVVDKTRWKEIRRKEEIRVYKERKSSLLKSTRMKGYLGEGDGSVDPVSTLPPLMVVGTVVGDLDDVMYATTTPTVEAMKIKTAYIDDGLAESKVLQQIISPSRDEPFRNLAVKWCVVHPPKVQSIIRPRDYVYIDSTGIVISPSGERIGYRITHSIIFHEFPSFEASHGMVRGNTSVCCLYRQRSSDVVDCFVSGFFELHGDIMKSLALLAIAGQGMSFSKQIHCAQMKKLAWRLQQRNKASNMCPVPSTAVVPSCRVCCREFNSSSSRFSIGPITKRVCTLCDELVCSKCRVKKRLFFMGQRNHIVHQDLSFCSPCLTETIRMDAYEIAKDEFFRGDAYNLERSNHFSRTTRARTNSSSSSSTTRRDRTYNATSSTVLTSQSFDPLDELWADTGRD